MRQLSGIDTMLLSAESARWPMHIASVHVIDPSTASQPITVDVLKEHLRSKLHLLGAFRQRLVESPLRLGRPYWMDDADFDLDFHVRRVGVPYPGRREDFAELVADVSSRPLDRARPLWEWWLVEGLENGYIAYIWKIHHAYLDGVAWVALGEVFYDREPTPRPVAPPEDEWTPENPPGPIPLLVRSLVDLAAIPRRLARLGVAGVSTGRRYRELRPRFDTGELARPQMPSRPPRVSFNGSVTPHRSWAFATIPLGDMKTVKHAVGVKLNDVVLAVCAGALRRYLAGRGELPEQPLIATVPVSTRDDDGGAGNQIASMTVSLATDVEDPVERLRAVYASSQGSKVMQQALGAEVMMGLADVPPPALVWLGAAFLAWSGLARRMPPIANVMISNVPGPRETLYFGGGEIKAVYSTGVVLDGLGLMIGLGSYRDHVNLSITTCKELVPDPWLIADALGEELEMLVKAVTAASTHAINPSPKRKR